MSAPTVFQTSAGGVVVRRLHGRFEVCLTLRTRHGNAWGLPKGHVEAGEEPSAAAVREVREETGLIGEILEPLSSITYQFRDRQQARLCSKTVVFFLMRALRGRLDDHDTETLEARWMAFDDAMANAAHENERQVLQQAQQVLARSDVAARFPEAG